MRSFVVMLIIFLVSVFCGLKIAEDPGFAFFSYQNWSVEMPLWLAVIGLLVVFFLGYWVVQLVEGVDFSLYRFRNWRRLRKKNRSYSKTNRGLVELVEGNWQTAEDCLIEGIAQSDAPLINYLAAAKAAHERGAYDKRDAYLRKAHDVAPHAELAIGLTQARLLFEQGQLEQSLATLGHLRTIAPKHKVVLRLLERVYVRLGDWQELLKLLPNLRKAKIIDVIEMEIFEKNIYLELLNSADIKKSGEISIRTAFRNIPRKFQKDPEIICAYVKLMLPYPAAANELEVLLSRVINQQWNVEAVKLYGLLPLVNPTKELTKAENWMKKFYPDQAILLLTLGRLAMRCQLWGKARDYYEGSLRLEVVPETFVEYGKLLEKLGEHSAAITNYRNGLLTATDASAIMPPP
ncbi:MAG: heme biosynthesis HemY N-terminal domain-containing protein [Pseudomonadota bacterium]